MSTFTVPLLDLLRKAGVDDTDFLREAVEWSLLNGSGGYATNWGGSA
ncbi:MAG: hypothetical protein OWR62_16125 [Sulfobacillus thermotolerans]|nr:hypothetical protein [Sulfobacillus thermotolerans]